MADSTVRVRSKKMEHTDESGSDHDEQYEEDSDSISEDEEDSGDEQQVSSTGDDEEEEEGEDEQTLDNEEDRQGYKQMRRPELDKNSDESEGEISLSKDEDDSDNDSGSDDESSSPGRTSKKRKKSLQEMDSASIKKKAKDNKKPSKPGIIYLSRIPPFMKPKKMNFIFGQYGEVGRIFLQQEDKSIRKMRKKKGGNKARSYTEGWIEFKKKKIAKRVAATFNNTRIGDRKRSRYYDDLWNIKYLPRFQWAHLMERIEYEKQVRQQRIRTEVMQAKKETNFYLKNVEQQKVIDRMKTKKSKQGKDWDFKGRNFKQWKTEEERADDRRMLQEEMGQRSGKVNSSVLGKIFKQ